MFALITDKTWDLVVLIFPWVLSLDGALLIVLAMSLANQHLNYPDKIVRTPGQRGTLAISFALAMALNILSLMWDLKHDGSMPYAQFPLNIRMAFTFPILGFAHYALISMVFAKRGKKGD